MSETSSQPFDPFAGPVILASAPSTEAQREIWTASALGDDASLAFNESITVRLKGALDLPDLELALADLVDRHDALRMTFSADALTLLVSGAFAPQVAQHDLASLEQRTAAEELVKLARIEVEEPFDLTRGPLFRVHFIRLGVDDHALIFTAHHIVCDGWSTAILVRDWARLYNARRRADGSQLAPAEAFADYARARAESPLSGRGTDESYWLSQFAGEVPVLDLPTDRPRPPRKTYRALRQDLVLPAKLVAAVRKAGARSRASLFATLLATFKALVFRLSGQSALVVGIPSAGQASEGHSELVGHCVNMLPLRSAPNADEAFPEFLGRVRKTLLDAQEHQDFTLGTLLTKLPISRDPSRLPLISVIFNVDRGMSSEAIGFEGVEAHLRGNPRSYENFDLFLNAVEIDGRLELECQHNADLFDASTVQRWLASYGELLTSFANNHETRLGDLVVATEAERLQLAYWNATDTDFPRQSCVHDLVDSRVRQNAAAVACEFGEARLTFGELNERANRLARRLREIGVRRGTLVGVCLERGLDLLVSLLAVLKAGAGYVPLDPDYPRERLGFMVEDSHMHALITQSVINAELSLGASRVLHLDIERDALSKLSSEPLPVDEASADPESVAYVIYTSGSTGKPKGVLVPHRSVVNLLCSVAKRPGLTAQDVVLAITTLSFDIAVSEVWLPLVVGAKIVLASREVAADGALLREVCENSKVTFIDATPATYRLLLAAGWSAGRELTLICTGEAMPRDLAVELPRLARAVWNGYGPTETTVWSTFWQVPENAQRVLIGKPVDNTRIYVLDARHRPAPLGALGEIFIAGDGVSHGYLNRPELTKEKFLSDPFDVPGRLMYRTGDVGRYLNNGDLECLGRNDNQIKLRGFRIELGEIEDALTQHAQIAEAAVILREDRPGDAQLVAYLVARSGSAPPAAELRAHLKKSLPDYMVPATFSSLERMPLTPSGKIDRRALPAPSAADRTPHSDFVAARSATEDLLGRLWSTALNVARVSIHDDFFALGGHSLLASQILARLRREHGIELSFRRFFEAPTIARLAELIDGTPVTDRATVAIQRRNVGVEVPLSLAQERLWLLEEMHPAQRLVHNLPAAWRLSGAIDRGLLQRSLDHIAARHEILRMTLAINGNRASQRIAERVELPIDFVDLSALSDEQRHVQMHEQIRMRTAEVFDLERGPLFRSVLFKLNTNDHVYFTLRHNIIWDGWSFDIFLQELCVIYGSLLRNEPPRLPELAVSYGDYVLWQREWATSPELARQVEFWQKALAGDIADLELPRDYERPAQATYAGANSALSLTRADVEALGAVAQRANTTLFNVLFAAYAVLLNRYSGQTEIVVGTPVRARTLPEVEGLIGPFINAVVLRTKLDPSRPFLDYLADVRDLTLDAFSHQEMPLELLGTRPPIVRAFFSFQDARSRPALLGSTSITQIDVEPPAAANDLMLWMMDRPSELLAVANFNTEVFSVETISRLLRSFATLLRDIAAQPTLEIGRLSILADADREQVTTRIAVGPVYPGRWAHDALLSAGAESPDAVAIAQDDQALDYAELLRTARTLAGALRARLTPGSVVALVLPRSPELVCAVFGAFMAGLTVMVIDPRFPAAYSRRLASAAAPVAFLAGSDGAQFAEDGVPVMSIAELSQEKTWQVPDLSALDPGVQAAWLSVRFDAKGQPVFSHIAHADLLLRAQLLAEEMRSARTLQLSAEPSSESLPLELVLGCVLRSKGLLAAAAASGDEVLSNVSDDVSAAIASTSAWANFAATNRKAAHGLTAVVYGAASGALLTRLLPSVGRLLTVSVTPALEAMFIHAPRGAHESQVLGKVVGTAGVSVLDVSGKPVPLGAPGRLVMYGDSPVELGLRGRRREGGIFDAVDVEPTLTLLSGLRFDTAEVSNALAHHKAVSRSVARLELDDTGAPRLVVYFAHVPGQSFTETELRRQLRSLLPETMVAQVFVELEALPITPDGMIDYARLPAPFGSDMTTEYVAPRTPTERRLADIFAEALKLPRVGVYDNFFDLGGHSLLCFRVIERIELDMSKRLSPRTLLLNSVEQVASELDSESHQAAREPAGSQAIEDAGLPGRMFKRLRGLLKR